MDGFTMSDIAITDALLALAKGQLLTVEELRETRSITRGIFERLGQICDQNAEIIEQMGQLRRDSERSLRVVKTELADVVARLKPIEEAYRAQRAGGSR